MSFLSLSDVTEESLDKQEQFYIDMTDFYIEDYEKILIRQSPILKTEWDFKENITVMDLFNIPYENHDEIKEFIKHRIWINIDTKEWIDEINKLFQESLSFYEKRYLRILPVKFKKLNFKRAESVIKFIKDTKSNKRTWILNCAIAKIAYAVDDVLSNPKVHRAEFLDRMFIEKYLERPFQIEESDEKQGIIYRKWKAIISNEIVEFTMISRCKSEESIEWKQIADPKYYSVEEFKDLVWVTIYTASEKDTLLLMQFIDWYVFKSEAKIDNKNWISQKGINKNRDYLHKEFFEKIVTCMFLQEDKWKGSSEDYKEIKLKWEAEIPREFWEDSALYPVWTEIKFVIKWQDNEKGLSLHAIYDYIKRFRELTRLGLPIRELDIVNYVNDFFWTLSSKLEVKNKDVYYYLKELAEDLKKEWFLDENFCSKSIEAWIKDKDTPEKTIFMGVHIEELALWLYKYFKSTLIPVKVWTSKKNYYFSKRALNLSELWLHKPMKKVDE